MPISHTYDEHAYLETTAPASQLTLADNMNRKGLIQPRMERSLSRASAASKVSNRSNLSAKGGNIPGVTEAGGGMTKEEARRKKEKKKKRLAALRKKVGGKLPSGRTLGCCGGRSWVVGQIETLCVEWQELKDERWENIFQIF